MILDLVALSAKEHFIEAAAGNIPAAVAELESAASNGMILMHVRDYNHLADAVQKYLGHDVYSEKVLAEWNALDHMEQERIEHSAEGYGRFGLFHRVSREEVPLALLVAAKLLSKDFKMGANNEQRLRDPKMIELITTRFPIIRETDIAEALELNS